MDGKKVYGTQLLREECSRATELVLRAMTEPGHGQASVGLPDKTAYGGSLQSSFRL